MPPKNWMISAAGTVGRSDRGPKKRYASSRPAPGPGLASSMNRIDLPCSWTSAAPSGVSTPWLIALLRNRTFAGSMMTDDERQQAVVDEGLDPVAEAVGDPADHRLDDLVAEDRHDAAEDADAEVVDEHLEAGLDLARDEVVEQLQQVRRQRSEDEGTQDHDLSAERQHRACRRRG